MDEELTDQFFSDLEWQTLAPLHAGLTAHFTPEQLVLLNQAHIAIAGAGGIGSNVAMMLARSGIGHLTIADCDALEASNLNRQHYWPEQIGQAKVKALAWHLQALNPNLDLHIHHIRITEANVGELFKDAGIWVEALDQPDAKKFVVEAGLLQNVYVAAASGIAGYGGPPMQKRKVGKLCVVGDFVTDIKNAPPLAPRVMQAAAMLADCVLEIVLG